MTQEDKELLLNDLCARLSYGVKILHTGWDCDGDTDFDTIETLIGIDDKFIYTVWDKTGDREKHCLSVSNWKPYLRPMSSMTEEEEINLYKVTGFYYLSNNELRKDEWYSFKNSIKENKLFFPYPIWLDDLQKVFDWLNKNHFDYRGLISKKLAIAVTKENNPYEN